MNVLLAPDTFKDSLSAEQVAKAMEKGLISCVPSAQCYTLFASDGGEGFLASVEEYLSDLHKIMLSTSNPLGRPIETFYLWNSKEKIAYIELAKASGIELLSDTERNVMETTTYGTGILIKDAINRGASRIYLGIGGSATNDAGMGIAQALGYRFFDVDGTQLTPKGKNLSKVKKITFPKKSVTDVEFYAVNDVLNPLYGPKGAAHTYGKQKGASPEEILLLDKGLENIHEVVSRTMGLSEADTPGSGAAGGTAYGLKCFLGAQYVSGTQFILDLAQFEHLAEEHSIDFILTGEGKIDFQTAYGKFIHGITQAATILDIPVLGVCGKLELNEKGVRELGLKAVRQIYDPSKPIAYSFENAALLISERVEDMVRNEFPELIQ